MSDNSFFEDQYTYDGWLVFNELILSEGYDEEVDPEEIVNSFPEYESGKPTDSQSGFKRQPLPDHLEDIPDLTSNLNEFAEDLYAFKFIEEDWVEQWGYDEDANQQLYYKDNRDEVDLFWDAGNDVMMLKGDKQLLDRKRKELRSGLGKNLHLDSISFDFEFFLWVLYKEYKEEQLSPNLSVRKITRGKTIGEQESNLGKEISVKGSENILRSVMMIAPLLDGKKIEALQGDFIMGTNQVIAEIEYGGMVHVKVSDSPMRELSDFRRMSHSIRFLSELVDLYQEWDDLDTGRKYPPASFFDELSNIAEEEDWVPRRDPEDVKDEYARKRSSDSQLDNEDEKTETVE